ncbi:hypothetical protein B0H11DRAFT_185675, partial [Mycena galericulata]
TLSTAPIFRPPVKDALFIAVNTNVRWRAPNCKAALNPAAAFISPTRTASLDTLCRPVLRLPNATWALRYDCVVCRLRAGINWPMHEPSNTSLSFIHSIPALFIRSKLQNVPHSRSLLTPGGCGTGCRSPLCSPDRLHHAVHDAVQRPECRRDLCRRVHRDRRPGFALHQHYHERLRRVLRMRSPNQRHDPGGRATNHRRLCVGLPNGRPPCRRCDDQR